MNYFFSSKQRNELLNVLNEAQRSFLMDHLKRGKRTVLSNELVKGKGHYYGSDQELDQEILQWEFMELLDGGVGNRPYRCECGMALRFQYIVRNRVTGEIKKFGRNHFEFHTGIPAVIVKDIIKGFEQIDYELDEILFKIQNGWDPSVTDKAKKYKIEVPADIQEHNVLGLPLLDKQISRLNKLIMDKEHERREKELAEELEKIKIDRQNTKAQPKKFTIKPVITSPLGDNIHQFIIELIEQNGTISVLEICESINVIPHPFKGNFLTGKPKAFPVVTMVMEQLVTQGAVIVEEESFDDRWYSVN